MVSLFADLTLAFITFIALKIVAPSVVVVEGAPRIVATSEVALLGISPTTTAVMATPDIVLMIATTTTIIAAATRVMIAVVRVVFVVVVPAAAARSAAAIAFMLATKPLAGSLAAARSAVGRRLEAAYASPMEHLDSLIEVFDHGEELLDGDRISTNVQCGDDEMIIHIKPRNDERHQLVFPDQFSCHCKFIRESSRILPK